MMRVFLMRMRKMNIKFHAFDVLALLPGIMDVKFAAQVQKAQRMIDFILWRAQIAECRDSHIAADSGQAVEIDDFHLIY